jgi:asparagine synthetase B (glutamine-hydrolysing)
VTDRPFLHHVEAADDHERIAARIRTAFHDYAQAQRGVTTSVVELSGGFDSTLAVAVLPTQRAGMRGVSVEYPYYEFRFEAAIQQAVGSALEVPRTVFDGTEEFPYTPAHAAPRFDEPMIFMTGIRHAERMARFAHQHGASRLYVGHGGDQLFCTDLLAREAVSTMPERAPFSAGAWRALRTVHREIGGSAWLQRATACFVYDACQDVWAKETHGLTVRTPFTDLALFRAALQWSHWCAARGARPDKTILSEAMVGALPREVIGRKGKVAYDGVWMRGYAHNADHLAGTIEGASALLEHIGLAPAWLVRRVRQLAALEAVSGREVMGAYAISTWLSSWGIQRPSDVEWAREEQRAPHRTLTSG